MDQNAFYNFRFITWLHLAESITTQSEGFKFLKLQDLLHNGEASNVLGIIWFFDPANMEPCYILRRFTIY